MPSNFYISPSCLKEPTSNTNSSAIRSRLFNNGRIPAIPSQGDLELRSISSSNATPSFQSRKCIAISENKENTIEGVSDFEHYLPGILLNESPALSLNTENDQNIMSNHENNKCINENLQQNSISCDICGNYFKSTYHLRDHHFVCIQANSYKYTEFSEQFSNDDESKLHMGNKGSAKSYSHSISKTDGHCNENYGYLETESFVKVITNEKYNNSFLNNEALLDKSYEQFLGTESLNTLLKIQKRNKLNIHKVRKVVEHNNNIESDIDKNITEDVQIEDVHCCKDEKSVSDNLTVTKLIISTFKCDICKENFTNQSKLNTHHKTHTNNTPFNSTENGEQFQHIKNFKRHLGIPKGRKPDSPKLHTCRVCSKSFQWQTRLNKHLRIHANTREFKCVLCGKGFNQESTLKTHMLTHSGEKAYKCSICDQRFGMKSSLTRHLKRHAGNKSHQCDVCNHKFFSLGELKKHFSIHTGELPFDCGKCHKRFRRRSCLNAHLASHTGNLPHKCDICEKKFFNKHALIAHSPVHTNYRRFVCDVCAKSFKTKNALVEHYRIHTGEKPYVCSYCNKAFSTQSKYDRHVMIHTGKKPYKCKICKMLFNQSTSLKRHYVVHTKEKPYSCDICSKSFTQKSYLSIHKNTHLKKKPHVCKVCDKSFSTRPSLIKHVCQEGGYEIQSNE